MVLTFLLVLVNCVTLFIINEQESPSVSINGQINNEVLFVAYQLWCW
jgi:hypothetical protein